MKNDLENLDFNSYDIIISKLKEYDFIVNKRENKINNKLKLLKSDNEYLMKRIEELKNQNEINKKNLKELKEKAISILKEDIISTHEIKEKNQMIITIKI